MEEILNNAEQRAIKRAEQCAYEATEPITNADIQSFTFEFTRFGIITGIRLMREEIENEKVQNTLYDTRRSHKIHNKHQQ